MSVTVSIRFLTGRAHLHPWQTHHSEGRVEWPPSPWRLLRALVAVAGRGLTTLPYPDFVFNPSVQSADRSRRRRTRSPEHEGQTIDYWQDQQDDCIKINQLTQLLAILSATPTIWLPKTSGGHTRQYFPIHDAGMVKNTGSAVFDTFATVRKDQPLCLHWPESQLDEQQQADLQLLLGRMTYFGRAESWCRAEAHTCLPEEIRAEGVSGIVRGQTHWECVCIEDGGKPAGGEYRDYLLERRLAPVANLNAEVGELLSRTKASDGKSRKDADARSLKAILQAESPQLLLLRCLLRESGQDIKDGLERPIGTRWVHYAVQRAVYDVPRPKAQLRTRPTEAVDLVRYALNTTTVHRPVLPPLTDTLLVADKFRSAVMALCREPSRALSGHEEDGSPCKDHQHAFWWPIDEDNDGFIDTVMVWAPGGFEHHEIDGLRRLTRLRQRGGRPDLLVSPTYVGLASEYPLWKEGENNRATTFISATPYFCPLHLCHGKGGSGRARPLTKVICDGLRRQEITEAIEEMSEIVFDYALEELMAAQRHLAAGAIQEPIAPRQYFPLSDSPAVYPPLPRPAQVAGGGFQGACLKDPDSGFPFGLSVGLRVNDGSRFIRALSFCRRRRNWQVKGYGRMLMIRFSVPRAPRPFAIGAHCHFGLGLFIPIAEDLTGPNRPP